MKNPIELFGKITFCDFTTATKLRKQSEFIKEYKGYTISFGKPIQGDDGRYWYRIKIWTNDGDEQIGEFASRNLCASDAEAVQIGIKWAKAHIDNM